MLAPKGLLEELLAKAQALGPAATTVHPIVDGALHDGRGGSNRQAAVAAPKRYTLFQ